MAFVAIDVRAKRREMDSGAIACWPVASNRRFGPAG